MRLRMCWSGLQCCCAIQNVRLWVKLGWITTMIFHREMSKSVFLPSSWILQFSWISPSSSMIGRPTRIRCRCSASERVESRAFCTAIPDRWRMPKSIWIWASIFPLQEVAAYVPMDRVLCETDSPYLSPVPKRGQRNDPSNVALVIRQLAQCKGIEPEEAARHTMENGKAVFAIEE